MGQTAYEKMDATFQKFKTHHRLTEEFMQVPHTNAWARQFRELAGLSMREMGWLTGYTKSGVQNVESGGGTRHYFDNLDTLWGARNLAHLPTDFQVATTIPASDSIPLSRVATETGEWRRCPVCHEVKWYGSRKKVYCSVRCRHQAYVTGIRVRYATVGKRPKAFICPHCGVFLLDYKRYLVSDYTDKSFREAPTDTIRSVERTPNRDEVSFFLRRLEILLRAETDAEVQTSGSPGATGDVFQQMLREYYDAAQAKARLVEHPEGGGGRAGGEG